MSDISSELWRPTEEYIQATNLYRFARTVEDQRNIEGHPCFVSLECKTKTR